MLKSQVAIILMAAAVAGGAAAQDVDGRALQAQSEDLAQARAQLAQARVQLERAAQNVAKNAVVLAQPGWNFLFPGSYERSPAQMGLIITDAETGALVTRVTPDGAGDEAGLKAGDIIRSIDGIDLSGTDESPSSRLIERLDALNPGDTVHLVVSRGGETSSHDVTLESNDLLSLYTVGRPSTPPRGVIDLPNGPSIVTAGGADRRWFDPGLIQPFALAAQPWGDMELVPMTQGLGRYFDTDEGLLVVRKPSDDAIGIEDGDVILTIGGRTPNSPEHAIRILSSFEAGETIEISLMRDGRRQMVEYEVPSTDAAARIYPLGD